MKPYASSIAQFIVVSVVAVVTLAPSGAPLVDTTFARSFYPPLQGVLTAASNRIGASLFDVTMIALAVMLMGGWAWWIRGARRQRSLWPLVRGLAATVTGASVVYLWFLTVWGFNYERVPMASRVSYDATRVTPVAVRLLAERAVAQANGTYDEAHRVGFPSLGDVPPTLVVALHEVERELGRPQPTVPAHPKWSIFTPYFRATGVSGMLAPFFLETLINPDLTGPERPLVLAHEWAHLSGFAPESEASFVGVITALRADVPSQYSAWLDLVTEATNQLQPVTRRQVLAHLAPGPVADQQAINRRLERMVRPVQIAAWATYDRMLKSQGVEEGVQSYSRVIQLLLATNALRIAP